MVKVDELVLIDPQTGQTVTMTEKVNAYSQQGVATVQFPASAEPVWAGTGTEVVAADNDGSIQCAFTTRSIGTANWTGTSSFRLYRENPLH